jgi:hypothetical protein
VEVGQQAHIRIIATVNQNTLLRQNLCGIHATEIGMRSEKIVNHSSILVLDDAARRVHQPATYLHQARCTGEDVTLLA